MRQVPFVEVERYRVPLDRSYDRDGDLWVADEGDFVRVGIHELGVETFGDLAALMLVPPGTELRRGDEIGSVEAQKYVGGLRAPVGGTVAEVNHRASESPRTVQEDPYGGGWLLLMRPGRDAERDRAALVAGDDVAPWFEARLREYRERGAVAE